MAASAWATPAIFGLVFILLAAGNAYAAVMTRIIKRRNISWIPLIGGAAGSLALIASPIESAHSWWWVPLVLDWGSAPGLVHTGVVLALGRTYKEGRGGG